MCDPTAESEIELKPTALPRADVEPWNGEQSDRHMLSGSRTRSCLGTTGSGQQLQSAAAYVLNLDGLSYSPQVEIEVDHWRIVLETALGSHVAALQELGGYGITHRLSIHRSALKFTSTELSQVLNRLFHFLGFVNGRLAGIAVPVGFDDEHKVSWCQWSVTTTDAWRPNLTWFDRSLAAELPALFVAWYQRTRDPFWKQVLHRATRMVADANHPSPVDVAVATAASGLELLVGRLSAWTRVGLP